MAVCNFPTLRQPFRILSESRHGKNGWRRWRRNYNLKNIPAFDELIQQRNVKSNLVPKDDLFDGGDPAKPATQKRKLVPKEDEEIQLILPEDAGSISCMSAKKVSEMFPAQQILSWKLRLKMSCGLS
jgi:hypothetical protein